MKIEIFKFVLFLAFPFLSEISCLKFRDIQLDAMIKIQEVANLTENGDCPPTNSANTTNFTKPGCETGSVGWSNEKIFNINKPPYKLTGCSQVLIIEGKTILDYDDCSKVKVGFFTMSPYMINYFETKNRETLLKSIPVENMTQLPTIVPGFKKECLDFVDSKLNEKIAICLSNKEAALSLYKAFIDFMTCRLGNNLQQSTSNAKAKCKEESLTIKPQLKINTSYYKMTPPGS